MYRLTLKLSPEDADRTGDLALELGAGSVSSSKAGDMVMLQVLAEDSGLLDSVCSEEILKEEITEDSWKYLWQDSFEGIIVNQDISVIPAGRNGKDLSRGACRYRITLDSRDAFGSGSHATTRLCMEALQDFLEAGNPQEISVLDAGTGSGVLAILAEMMGAGRVDAFDIDEQAVARAAENFRYNHTEGIHLSVSDLMNYESPVQYDLITANLLTGVIISGLEKLKGLTAPDGVLIISGIGLQWDEEVQDAFKREGLALLSHRVLENWSCYILRIIRDSDSVLKE